MSSRLSPARIVGIAAWTAASVMWGAAAVAFASKPPEAAAEPPPLILALPETTTTTASVPTMPESGLVVLRYTPVARPEAEVIVREVRVAGPASSSPAASAPASKPKKTTTTSSGS
jgi:hypothetical protein